MGKCTKCGTNFVGTPENPPTDGLCSYCEIEALRLGNANANGIIGQMADEIERLTCALSGLIQECEYSASSGLPFNALGSEWTQLAKAKALVSKGA